MTFEEFIAHVNANDAPANGMSKALCALWHAQKGQWERAHEVSQDMPSTDGSWIHANLHREEGDIGNAQYWYRRAGRTVPDMSYVDERHELIRHFLDV